jgi:hypothetical protein
METRVGVEVIWDKPTGRGGWCWQVRWSDGPSVPAMRVMAERALHEIGSLAPDGLRYARLLTQPTIALAMIRQLRLGRPPLGEHGDLESFLDALDNESYPEHGCDEELAAAERLGGLSDWLDWRMAEILAQAGLAAIAERRPGDNVISFHARRAR